MKKFMASPYKLLRLAVGPVENLVGLFRALEPAIASIRPWFNQPELNVEDYQTLLSFQTLVLGREFDTCQRSPA